MNSYKKQLGWKTGLIFAIIILSVWAITPLSQKMNLGLDLKGGMHMVLNVQVDEAMRLKQHSLDKTARNRIIEQSIRTIRERVDKYGVTDASVQQFGVFGDDKILVSLPGVDNPERVKDLIKSTAMLEFRAVKAGPFDAGEEAKAHFGNQLPPELEILAVNSKRLPEGVYVVAKTPVISGDQLKTANTGRDGFGAFEVHFSLNKQGAKRIRTFTAANIGAPMALLFDGLIENVARIDGVLGKDNRITGNYTFEEVSDMVIKLRAGALAAPMKIMEERVIGPSLGVDLVKKGVTATIVGLVLVILFMLFYYRRVGINSVIALALNLIILLAGMALFGFSLTLPGIAGIILTIGMAVDANVLIFERIKEEIRNGAAVRTAIEKGFKKAFVTILDANLTTVIAAFFLLQFGTGPVKGFAIVLILGICASMFTALFVSRVIFQFFTPAIKYFESRRVVSKASKGFEFMSKRTRWITLSISLSIILVGTVLFVGKGFNTGIDFAGGTMMDIHFENQIQTAGLRTHLAGVGVSDVVIQETGSSGKTFLIQSPDSSEDKLTEIKKGLAGLGEYKMLSLDRVGPNIGEGLKQKTTLAAVWALMGMLIYIALRFRFIYGVAAVLTLFHDVLITLSLLLVFNIRISLPVVAALMMVIGYSLNDTIVIFDRVRENLKYKGKSRGTATFELLNRSIGQTLSRTMVTSGTTLLAVLALLLMGSGVLAAFAFTLAAGILIGTYSSVFLSCLLLARA